MGKDNIIAVSLSDDAMEFLEEKMEKEGRSFSKTIDLGVRFLRQLEKEREDGQPSMGQKRGGQRKYHFNKLKPGEFFKVEGGYTRKRMQSVHVAAKYYMKTSAPDSLYMVRKIGNELAVLRIK